MNDFRHRLRDKYRTHWVSVKFYKEKLRSFNYKTFSSIRFCEAVLQAMYSPILLDFKSISCPGANYTFDWNKNKPPELISNWQSKRAISKKIAKSLLKTVPQLKDKVRYIGLNTEGDPDLFIAYPTPEEAMHLIKTYQDKTGEKLEVDLSGVISICGNVAVKTYLTGKINLSFGCDDSRKYTEIGRERLVLGIPKKLFKIFIDDKNLK